MGHTAKQIGVKLEGERAPGADQAVHHHQITPLKPIGAEEFQGGEDNGKVDEELASRVEAESQLQTTEDDDELGGEENSEDASEGQPENAKDTKPGGRGKGSAVEFTSTEDNGESGGEWTTNRAKRAKSGPLQLEVGGVCAPVPSFSKE